MTKPNEKLVEFPRQSARDILTDVLRDGAQQMLATAIEAEVDDYPRGSSDHCGRGGPTIRRPQWSSAPPGDSNATRGRAGAAAAGSGPPARR